MGLATIDLHSLKEHTEIYKIPKFGSLLRRGLFRRRPGERQKRQRTGNAGKGKERREASAIFRAVGWSDSRFGGYG